MNKLLKNYIKASEDLEEYFGIDNLNWYSVNILNYDYFSIINNNTIGWAETKEDLENQDGEYYEEEIITINETDELTLILCRLNSGIEKQYLIFNNKNKI